MAVGKWGTLDDLRSGIDENTFSRWFTVRMRFHEGKLVEFASAAPHINVPSKAIEQKLALLKVAPVGAKVDGVGWRRTEDIFYLRFYEEDVLN